MRSCGKVVNDSSVVAEVRLNKGWVHLAFERWFTDAVVQNLGTAVSIPQGNARKVDHPRQSTVEMSPSVSQVHPVATALQ